MNSNQIRYLKSVLENSTNQRLSFKVKSEVVVDYSKEGMVNISLDDIDTINKGKKELYNSRDWAKNPSYTCDIKFDGYHYLTFITGVGPNCLSAPAELKLTVLDFKGRTVCREDIYQLIRNNMKGQKLTSKRRLAVESEIYKLMDKCARFDLKEIVKKAVINADI